MRRTPPKSSAGIHELPEVSPAQFARDFQAHVRGAGIRDLEEFSQTAALSIATPLQLLGSVRGPNANPRRFWPTGISRKVDRRRVASPGGPSRTCSPIEVYPTNPCKTILWAESSSAYTWRYATADARRSPMEGIITVPLPLLAFRRILRSRHDPAGDLPHMFSGIGKLALQELRLNLQGFLKIGRVNQLARMFERSLQVLFGERQRLLGNLRPRGRD